MTSDILKRAAEAALLPCPFCGRAAHLRDDASHSTAAFIGCETEGCFGYMLWAETATDAAREWNQRPDMAAAIAERDAENARLTAEREEIEAVIADLLTEILPWVEAQLDDPAYKPGTVRAVAKRIRAALGEKP